jgi:hypothetical protein
MIAPMTEGGDQPSFTLRYQVTPANARAATWFALRDWVPVLIGLVLTTLVCATWSPLGHAGRRAAIVIPILTFFTFLWFMARAARAVERYVGQEFVLSFSCDGLSIDAGHFQSTMQWSTLRRIARGRACWLFYVRDDAGQFYVPTEAIPAEARAFVARWAGEAGVRLT